MSLAVVVDASFLAKLVVPEPDSALAEEVWRGWARNGAQLAAPTLLPFEVASTIRKHVVRGLITQEYGRAALDVSAALIHYIAMVTPDDLYAAAWDLAERYSRPNLYDAYYVALAEALDGELWTADDRLCRAMPGHTGLFKPLTHCGTL
jgi:predicted nucleic acid-binding protein